MEVHHHPDIHHDKKRFKEYLLEFVMIFLAVTLGFLAENVRETYSDKNKERQYIEGFIQNLASDTAQIRAVMYFNSQKVKDLDSFLLVTTMNPSLVDTRKLIYHFASKCLFSAQLFKSNDATLVQLRNSGGYRLIHKDHVADSIAQYDARINYIYEQGGFYLSAYSQARELADKILMYSNFEKLSAAPTAGGKSMDFRLATLDFQTINEFFNKIKQLRIAIGSYCYSSSYLRGHLAYTSRLINFLKSAYDLN